MRGRNTILFSLLTVAVGLLFVADIAVGSVAIPLRDVAAALTGGKTDASLRNIIIDIRLIKAIMPDHARAALTASG